MKLTLLGGGGFRVPLMFRTLLRDESDQRVTELRLWDTDAERLAVIRSILGAMASGHPKAPVVRVAGDLDDAVAGADFVFSAIRAGGTEGRATEETIAHCCGVLGQETTGFGGLDYALRGIPTAVHIAEQIARLAPGAHLINFTNPAGIITEVSAQILGDRVIGICDSPVGLARRPQHAGGCWARAGRHCVPDDRGRRPGAPGLPWPQPPGMAATPAGRR